MILSEAKILMRLAFLYIILLGSLYLIFVSIPGLTSSFVNIATYTEYPVTSCDMSDYYYPVLILDSMTDEEKQYAIAQNESMKTNAEQEVADCEENNRKQGQYDRGYNLVSNIDYMVQSGIWIIIGVLVGLYTMYLIKKDRNS